MFRNNQQTNTFLAYLLPISMIVALLVFQSLAFQKSFFPVDQKLLPIMLRCNGDQIHIGKKNKGSVVFYSETGKNILVGTEPKRK